MLSIPESTARAGYSPFVVLDGESLWWESDSSCIGPWPIGPSARLGRQRVSEFLASTLQYEVVGVQGFGSVGLRFGARAQQRPKKQLS